jgi:hypothetical protein
MTHIDTCGKCGAALSPDLDWCGRCLTPRGPDPLGQDPARQRVPLQDAMRHRKVGNELAPTEFSRWKGGPTSFGPMGRTLLTIGLLVGLVIGEPLARGLVFLVLGADVPTLGFMALYGVMAVPLVVYLIVGKVWKRVRVA